LGHLLPLETDLLLHKGLGLLLHLRLYLQTEAIPFLLQSVLVQEVLVLDQLHFVDQLLLLCLLFLDALFLALDLKIQLLFLGEAPYLQMTALAVAYKVRRHVLEDRVQRLDLWSRNQLLVGITSRKVVFVEDLILSSRDCSDCQHQPSLVGVVLPHSVDARGDLESLQIHE
jgi:hypothetical protein